MLEATAHALIIMRAGATRPALTEASDSGSRQALGVLRMGKMLATRCLKRLHAQLPLQVSLHSLQGLEHTTGAYD